MGPDTAAYGDISHAIDFNGWRGIIAGVPPNSELWGRMPPPGGLSQANPMVIATESGALAKLSYNRRGKKVIKKIPKQLTKEISQEEALENREKLFKYLKQYNKKKDEAWENSQIASYKD